MHFKALPIERIRAVFEYRDDGFLIWKVRITPRIKVGMVAGKRLSSGYHAIRLDRCEYRAHRLIWAYHNGAIPDGMEIDHIDRDRYNNRINNLRLASHAENNFNRTKKRNTTSKYVGVHWDRYKEKWVAKIFMSGRRMHLGVFVNEEEAKTAYIEAALKLFGEFTSAVD